MANTQLLFLIFTNIEEYEQKIKDIVTKYDINHKDVYQINIDSLPFVKAEKFKFILNITNKTLEIYRL